MLALKRGYGISDIYALLYSLVQFSASIAANWLLTRIADRFGGRAMTIAGFCGFPLIALYWIVTPRFFCWPLLILPFLLCPCGTVVTANSLQQYFLSTVPKEQQVAGSMMISVGTGVIAGLSGMFLSGGLLKLSAFCSSGVALNTYRLYFLFVLIILPVLGVFVLRLEKKVTQPHFSRTGVFSLSRSSTDVPTAGGEIPFSQKK